MDTLTYHSTSFRTGTLEGSTAHHPVVLSSPVSSIILEVGGHLGYYRSSVRPMKQDVWNPVDSWTLCLILDNTQQMSSLSSFECLGVFRRNFKDSNYYHEIRLLSTERVESQDHLCKSSNHFLQLPHKRF